MRLRAALSFPIRSTSARPNISPRSASRRSPALAPAWPSPPARAMARSTAPTTLSHLRDLAEATDLPLNADFEAGFARDAEGRAGERAALHRRGRLGLLDRGLHRQPRRSALQCERSGRPAARGARGDQRQRREGALDRAQRSDPAPGRRPRRGFAPPSGLCGSRRRRSLRAAGQDAGGSGRSRARRGQAAGQCARRLAGLHQARSSKISASNGSASAGRSLAPPGAASCAPRRTLPRTGGSTPSPICRRWAISPARSQARATARISATRPSTAMDRAFQIGVIGHGRQVSYNPFR